MLVQQLSPYLATEDAHLTSYQQSVIVPMTEEALDLKRYIEKLGARFTF
jgi:hypothetical protein